MNRSNVILNNTLEPIYFLVLKVFFKKLKYFYFYLFQINLFLVFLDYFDMLMLK